MYTITEQQLILQVRLHDNNNNNSYYICVYTITTTTTFITCASTTATANVTGASTSSTANVRQQQLRVDLKRYFIVTLPFIFVYRTAYIIALSRSLDSAEINIGCSVHKCEWHSI